MNDTMYTDLGPKQLDTVFGPEKLFANWKCQRTIQDMGPFGKSVQHEIGPFKNGLRVSVIKGGHTYGGKANLWEIAPMNEHGFIGKLVLGWSDDVIGHLTTKQVKEWCEKVEKL